MRIVIAHNANRMPRAMRRLPAVLVLPLVAASCGPALDRLVLRPPPGAIDAGPATRQVIDAGGRELEIWIARSPAMIHGEQPDAYVLEFCGNATRAEQIAQYVAGRWKAFPIEAWVVNYPGYGGSEGAPQLKRIPPAALAAYDALASRAAGKPIFVEANSLGTTSALYVAANRDVAGLVLQNPPPLRSLILGRYAWWNGGLLALPVAFSIPKELDSLANAKKVRAPAVFLLAEQDEVVPPKYQRKVVAAYAGEKRLIPLKSAHHGDSVTGTAEEELDRAIDWLWQKK
jgi:pimeloyl-ACP methyl ester carboxylesterase